jgi:hypothetical protein
MLNVYTTLHTRGLLPFPCTTIGVNDERFLCKIDVWPGRSREQNIQSVILIAWFHERIVRLT